MLIVLVAVKHLIVTIDVVADYVIIFLNVWYVIVVFDHIFIALELFSHYYYWLCLHACRYIQLLFLIMVAAMNHIAVVNYVVVKYVAIVNLDFVIALMDNFIGVK